MKHILLLALLALCPMAMLANKTQIEQKTKTVKRNTKQTSVETYLDFLYRYMPQPDKTDYSREFYKQNIALALQARKDMPWGEKVSEDLFRHFVLPVRVNNENLDESRAVFFPDLKTRLKGLSMKEAILEVNHWCHERVTYRPSDARTSSPLASVRTAYGRCGEESTFLVAALRSVCIPARQVYTPRWAHTDDNHAWVEAWADGQWWFLGACEPEPVLNLGWFNESASRGLLMHTKVFGDYKGNEEVISSTPFYTEINVVDNYAKATKKTLRIVDTQDRPIAGARVEFKIYNYAEFFTVATKLTDARGEVSITAGLGDMIAWVSKDGNYAFKKINFRESQPNIIVLSSVRPQRVNDFDIIPPAMVSSLPSVTAEQRLNNDLRKMHEDSIRQAYEATMKDESRGNYEVINRFLAEAKNQVMAKKLLEVISKKDLRDIQLAVLKDNETERTDTSEIYCKYVLSPRVENEWLVPYKAVLRKELAAIKSPQQLLEWTRKNITIDNTQNPQHLRMSPLSVYRTKRTDNRSWKIFFVSAARSLGFPARVNEIDGRLQYWADGRWNNTEKAKVTPTGKLQLDYSRMAGIDDPKYYIHFSISKIVNGKTQLLTYPDEATWQTTFNKPVELETGTYMLITGTRLANGGVLAHSETFNVEKGKTTNVRLSLRESNDEVQVIGSLNAENNYFDTATGTTTSLLATAGRGYYVIGIIAPNHEPSNHTLRDIALCKEGFEKWGRKIFFLFENEEARSRFNANEFENMPSTVVWGTDIKGNIYNEIRNEFHLTSSSLPIFIIADSFNRVVFISQGYTIGLGEQLLKVIGKL